MNEKETRSKLEVQFPILIIDFPYKGVWRAAKEEEKEGKSQIASPRSNKKKKYANTQESTSNPAGNSFSKSTYAYHKKNYK